MADYRHSINRVLLTEGGYVNDPDDAGGETYRGISRKSWPQWLGWKFVDAQRNSTNFPKLLYSLSGLQDMVISFYKREFWDKVGGDQIASQTIADNLVDAAVNEGVKVAVKRAQGIVGLVQTGVVTPELVTKLNSLV